MIRPARPSRVCVITTSFPRVSGDLAGHFILAELRDMPSDVAFDVVAPAAPGIPGHETLAPNVRVHRFRYFFPASLQCLAYGDGIPDNIRRSFWAKANVPAFLAAMSCAAIRYGRRADFIHTHWTLACFAAVLTRRIHRRPVLVTVRGSDISVPNSILAAINRYALCRADAVLPVADSMVPALTALGVRRERIRVLPAAMYCPSDAEIESLRHSAPANGGRELRILFVGRLVKVKGVDVLLRAFASLIKEGVAAQLTLVGDGAERPALELLAGELRISGKVQFAGLVPKDEVPRFLAAADLFVLSSLSEGMPYSLWEAMSFGLPCVATRVGGVSQLMRDGENGLLVEPGRSPELADAIGKLARAPALRNHLALAARQSAVAFSRTQSSIAECLLDVYNAVLDGKPPPQPAP